jgi:predicted acylesterase/phospholipase RssA
MFGAWQAGAWRSLAPRFKPDLVVGASVGSLNGYAIAAGWSASDLCAWWLRPDMAGFKHLPKAIRLLMDARPLEIEYAVVLVDLLRMKPHTVTGSVIQAEHLLASCAVPGAAPPRRIGGRWYLDGGLLNPLPVWAAVELGATHILALNALPDFPSTLLKPLVKGFRACFGHRPPLPSGVNLTILAPSRQLGSLRDAFHWKRTNIERWIEQGAADAAGLAIAAPPHKRSPD